jgi:hypothetical protein
MCKELRLSDSDFSLLENWEEEISEEYEEIEYLDGFHYVPESEVLSYYE